MGTKNLIAFFVQTFCLLILSTYHIAFSQEFTPDANTVGLWHFNEGSGTIANDASGNGNHGQITGASWTTEGKFGNALSFDGNGDGVQINSPFTGIQNTFTIELYFKSSNFIGGRYLFIQSAHMHAIVLAMPNDQQVSFSLRGVDEVAHEIWTNTPIVEDTWYRVCAAYDGNQMRLYLNDKLESFLDVTVDVSWSMNYFRTDFGDHPVATHGEMSFNGIIDEARISDIARDCGCVPVELTTFTTKVIENQVELNWTTATETNNLGFEIQKSRDKKNFYKIGFIRGNGTSLNENNYRFIDKNLEFGFHFYRLKQIDIDGSFEHSPTVEVFISPPKAFALIQNYPNPFNPKTEILFELPEAAHVELTIFNTLGQKIKTLAKKEFSAGSHTIRWDGTCDLGNQVSGGLYLCRMQARDFHKTLRMLYYK